MMHRASKSKCLEDIGRTNDPKYCKYHSAISHLIKKCKAFKEQVIQVPKERKITLGEKYTEGFD